MEWSNVNLLITSIRDWSHKSLVLQNGNWGKDDFVLVFFHVFKKFFYLLKCLCEKAWMNTGRRPFAKETGRHLDLRKNTRNKKMIINLTELKHISNIPPWTFSVYSSCLMFLYIYHRHPFKTLRKTFSPAEQNTNINWIILIYITAGKDNNLATTSFWSVTTYPVWHS